MRLTTLVLALLLALTVTAQTEDTPRRAVLLVHYGTNNDESRAKTIDLLNQKVREALPQCEVAEAYSSTKVIASLKKRGIRKHTVSEALRQLYAKGCADITIQSTHLLPGVMQEQMEQEAGRVRFLFDTIRIGKPLVWDAEDALQLAKVLTSHIAAGKNEQVVLVGHGTEGPANAMYALLDYALHDTGHANYHVATIEGYPGLDNIRRLLRTKKARNVTLCPLLYIAGNHAVEDISGEWREALQREGYQVSVSSEGLGEMPEIQQWILRKLKTED